MPGRETHHDNNEHEPAHHQTGHHHRRSTRSIAGLLGLLAACCAMALTALPSRATDEGPGPGATARLVSQQGGRAEPVIAGGDEPAARVASRGKSPFSLEGGVEGDTRLGVDGQCPDGVVLQQEQINGILVTRLGPGIREIDELFTRMMALTKLPGAAFVLCYQGRLVYAAGFGYSNLEDRIPFTPYTLCEIGSVTKPLAAMTILTLLDKGELSLDDRPDKILGWSVDDPYKQSEYDKVTVKHCLSHQMIYSRFVGDRNECARILGINPEMVSEEDLQKASMKFGLKFSPGTQTEYSGQGQGLLARIVERKRGGRFIDEMQHQLKRLGIEDFFSFNFTDDARRAMVPPSYSYDANTGAFVPSPVPDIVATGFADAVGSGVMSPLSLARFGDRFLNLYRDPARMARMMWENRSEGYMLGWRYTFDQNTKGMGLWHGGVIGGWRTGLGTAFSTGELFPGTTNVTIFNNSHPTGEILILRLLMGSVSPEDLDKYGIPQDAFGPELQGILPKLFKSGRLNHYSDLWMAAGYPN
ncbi:MAG: beta-lactamase family protein [Chthonomonadales bacterium]|nr:beta-lactamase family protein [Chthonomonadales bacterium]